MPLGYILQDLGELLHYSNDPAIQAGAVIGGQDATGGPFATAAAIWLPSGTTPDAPKWLLLPTGASAFPSSWAHAATPDLQTIVGFYSNTSDNSEPRACIWMGDPVGGYTFNRLPLPTDATFSIGYALSADGAFLAGEARDWNGVANAAAIWSFDFSTGSWTAEIVSDPALIRAYAIGISNAGDIAYGNIVTASGEQRAVRWVKSASGWAMEEFETATFAAAAGIVSNLASSAASEYGGQVSGSISGNTATAAVEWPIVWGNGATVLYSDPPNGTATATVGLRTVGYRSSGAYSHAYVWDRTDGEFSLHETGYVTSQAWAIDQQQNVCGVAQINGIWRIVKWSNSNPLP
jgi:hypothetical protein